MLIPGKLYSRVESCNSRVSIETLDFTRVRTVYWRDRSWIGDRGAKGGGAITDWPMTPFLANAETD